MPDIDEATLQEKLRRLRDAAPQAAGPQIEQHLQAALQKQRVRRHARWYVAAALLALALGWFGWHRRAPAPAPLTESPALSTFIALPYGQSDVPLESAVVVRVEIQSATGPVAADLLVGQDGMARAVRLAQ